MMRLEAKCSTFLCVLALALVAPAAMAQSGIKRLVVFGDSLSDPGNAFALLGTQNTPPDYSLDPFLVPDRPYARGGHHFSNGPTWVEQFARPLGLAGSTRPAWGPNTSPGAANYAVGGARARTCLAFEPPEACDPTNINLSQQVARFLSDRTNRATPEALYIIAIGGNDMRDAIVAYVGTLQATGNQGSAWLAATAVMDRAVASIATNIELLAARGAQTFLVWQVPNIGLTPALRPFGLTALGDGLAQYFIGGLAGLPSNVLRLDVYATLNTVTSPGNAGSYGLTDVTDACIKTTAPFECEHADEFLFWDGIHPTAAGHAIIAQQAAAALSH
jgi:phospholipase/lecithinase/hemolysin